jgi:metabolite-proton symporter
MTNTTTIARRRPSTRRLAIATFTGTAIEFYDFYLYGTAAALVFPKIFFPELDPVAGTLASLSTFGVAFLARPLGAAYFGHRGDRVGRRATLVVTLAVSGLATAAVGLLPSYAVLGVLAPVLLTVLRFVQGFGLGGEWAGSALLAVEHAPAGRRGRYVVFTQAGPAAGFVLANGAFLLLDQVMADGSFERWGWRLPFLASLILIGVGLYVRMRLAETPLFADVARRRLLARVPTVELLRHQWREVLLGAGTGIAGYALFYTTTVYFLSYGVTGLGIPRTTMLLFTLLAATLMAGTTALSAVLSDRFGRRRTALAATSLAVVWGLAMSPLFETGAVLAVGLAMCAALAVMGLMYGPAGALLPELFATRYRYSGAALSYNLGGVIGGAVTPVIATRLSPTTVGWYLSGAALVALLCLAAITDADPHLPLRPD